MSASSGDTIRVGPAPRRRSSREATKYTADLPQPVRCTTRARRPPSTRASMASNWPSWNSASGCPTSSRSTAWACSRVPVPPAEAGWAAERTAAFWLLAIASVSQPPPTATKPAAAYVDSPCPHSKPLPGGRGADPRKIEAVTSDQTKTFDLSASFKAYDVRGIVGESITAEIVEAVGAAFVDVLDLAGETVLVGGDMRPSSPEFSRAFANGAATRGANVQLLDLISTDE